MASFVAATAPELSNTFSGERGPDQLGYNYLVWQALDHTPL